MTAGTATARITDALTMADLPAGQHALDAALLGTTGAVVLDLSGVTVMDTAGAWLLATRQRTASGGAGAIRFAGASPAHLLLLQTVTAALPPPPARARLRRVHQTLADDLAQLGQTVWQFAAGFAGSLGFLGVFITRLGQTALAPSRLRGTALVHHMQKAGLDAVPIVVLMGFLIGIVLAFQGATQLERFGAEVFVVDLIAVSILRELGILLTAIIVAGRSASAFAAAIGSMKMREEIDAMRVLGLDPMDLLVLPRVLAMVITLPLLGFLASMAGLFGGGLMAWVDLGISPGLFLTQLLANTDVSHLLVGLAKAPVFAVIIGLVGCYQGLQVAGTTDALGSRTSRSVVVAIFLVIVTDAAFSIVFSVLGL